MASQLSSRQVTCEANSFTVIRDPIDAAETQAEALLDAEFSSPYLKALQDQPRRSAATPVGVRTTCGAEAALSP
jgi:hypothetical protein